MSDGDAERSDAIITRLEVLQFELRVESIWLYEIADPQGNSAIGVTATPLPHDFNFDGRRELWQLSAPLVRDGVFVDADRDGGLLRWLYAQAQPFKSPSSASSHLANPIKVWLDGVRNPTSTGPGVICANLVPGDPRVATAADMAAVADKARVLVGVFHESHREIERLENSIRNMRPKRGEVQRAEEKQYLDLDQKTLRWAIWNQCEWFIYADVVWHYSSALIPDDLANCRQVSTKAWSRKHEVDWPTLEKELTLLASKLQWYEPKRVAQTTAVEGVSIPSESKVAKSPCGNRRLRRSLQSARDELVLARQGATTFEELSTRSWRAVVQACHALHADVCLETPVLVHDPFWEWVKKRPGEWSDREAFKWWTLSVCPFVMSTSTVWAGSAGHYDFAPFLKNEAGKFVDRDGNELTMVTEPDGSQHWSGELVRISEVETDAEQMLRMQLRAKDWLDVIDRLIEMVDERPSEIIPAITSSADYEIEPVADNENGNKAPSSNLIHELTRQQSVIVKYLWNAKHATHWDSLPDACWRDGTTIDQNDRTVASALERLRDRLNAIPKFGLTLEVREATQTVRLVQNLPRK